MNQVFPLESAAEAFDLMMNGKAPRLTTFNQLKEYLSLLAEKGLIQYEEGTHTFRTTERGIHFLKLQNKIDEIAPISFISEK
jgi:hypothetical protein